MSTPDNTTTQACQWSHLTVALGRADLLGDCHEPTMYRATLPDIGPPYLLCAHHGAVANMDHGATLSSWADGVPVAGIVSTPDRRPGDPGDPARQVPWPRAGSTPASDRALVAEAVHRVIDDVRRERDRQVTAAADVDRVLHEIELTATTQFPPVRGVTCWFMAGVVVGTAVGISVVGDAIARHLEARRAR